MTPNLDSLRFPIGTFKPPVSISEKQIQLWIAEIEALPDQLKQTVKTLSEEDLNLTYRPNGWTIKQVIHHLADSHMNSYIRFKLAFTEENPTIRPYFEERWAECEEAKNGDIQISLNILEALHKRWALFLRSLKLNEWDKTFYHPENKQSIPLKEVAGLYAWHGKHHLNHILTALK
ncbi:MAG: YfiT family bacillithiol transferase [Sphingobacteriaceae bacterium]